jgi:hypothetical protein
MLINLEITENYMQMCITLLSKSVITASEFLVTFSDVFRNVSSNLDCSLLSNLILSLKKIQLQKSCEIFNLDKFEVDPELNFWELIARIHLLISILHVYPGQKEEINVIIRQSIDLLIKTDSLTNIKIELILDTVQVVIDSLESNFQDSFEKIWQFISSIVLCDIENGCPQNFYLMNQKIFKKTFLLVEKIFLHFSKFRTQLFSSLKTLVISMENIKTFITSNRDIDLHSKRKKEFLQHSKNTLEGLLMTDFIKKIQSQFSNDWEENETKILASGHLNEDQGATAGLVNLSSTCYFNSLVQQFANMEWFVKFVLENCQDLPREQYISKIDDGKNNYYTNKRKPKTRVFEGTGDPCILNVHFKEE